jgi:hypothetical protein
VVGALYGIVTTDSLLLSIGCELFERASEETHVTVKGLLDLLRVPSEPSKSNTISAHDLCYNRSSLIYAIRVSDSWSKFL